MARASIVISPVAIVRVVKANRDLIAGVKVRLGRNAGGARGGPLDIALEVAEETGLPRVRFDLDRPRSRLILTEPQDRFCAS
jgi:predicted amidohydrolase